MTMDETLYSVAEKVQNFAVIYLVDITEVPDFNKVRVSWNFLVHPFDLMQLRCMSCTTLALSCTSTGTHFGFAWSMKLIRLICTIGINIL